MPWLEKFLKYKKEIYTWSVLKDSKGLCGAACNLSTQEADELEHMLKGQPELHREFQASLGYTVRSYLKS